ncbi:Uncharacterised protein [Yersinia intermedia]|uniref:Uncharacterized protein n=1 Tax=Yersinia intermedia TaxID=631 RepID=A0ABX6FEZ3_YERIN|nr:hypothetical protein [Yersinia intermedia]MDN0114081.1 hypothetical protein [Yersinia intermedia]QGR68613.1 hypothetical protein FOC38_09380 [Yersinia intermedia]QGR73075.1 hypothetical protein FOC37_12680 [Yersinia intermedia]WET17159.1 hypothetical protein P2W49_12100 [Yersinia intermedia]CNB18801.1 Uncharacterised protein [Yersinia intermedia]
MHRIQTEYETLRASLSDSAQITLLHIGRDTSTVITDPTSPQWQLTVGDTNTAQHYFHHNPPTADEMETAIMVVEDEVIRISPAVNKTSQLVTTDSEIAEIAQLAGLSLQGETHLSLEAVERMFDRLAAVMMGRPAASEGIPADNVFAARLLILREFMHHLQFPSITILTL